MRTMRPALALVLMLLAACAGGAEERPATAGDAKLVLTSSAFAEGETIPTEFTCDGANASPPLAWSGVPGGADALVLTVEDPGAPYGNFVHWSVGGIDPSATDVARGGVPEGGEELGNDAGGRGYTGPCPPESDEPHRYIFTITAFAEDGSFLGSGTLTGTYGR